LAQIASDLGTTQSKVLAFVSSYFIGMAMGRCYIGPLLDRMAEAAFICRTFCFYHRLHRCLQFPVVEVLIGFRFLQALGGFVASVGAMAMVRDFYPVEKVRMYFRFSC